MSTEQSAEEMCRAAGDAELRRALDSLAILIRDKAHEAAKAEADLIEKTAVRLGHGAVGKSLRVDLHTREDGTRFAIIAQNWEDGMMKVVNGKVERALKCGCIPGRALCMDGQRLKARVDKAKAAGDQAGYWRALLEYDRHMKGARR